MKRLSHFAFALALAVLPCAAQNKVDGFIGSVYKSKAGVSMPYRLFLPLGYDNQRKYPLIVWLHGSGSVGADNLGQISSAGGSGVRIWTKEENQTKHPAFVLAPQSQWRWENMYSNELGASLTLVLEILESLKMEFNIDSQRIYVAGQSMGGYGTWDLITKRPDLFAAAIPLCGGGNPARAAAAAKVPIWAFHGDADPVVSVDESRQMIAAIKEAGGNPRYSEYSGVGHDVGDRAFREPELFDWLFSQHR